jgi:hypothetical protein
MTIRPTRKVTITLYAATAEDVRKALLHLAEGKHIAILDPTKAPAMIETDEVFGSLEIQKVIGSIGF